MRGPDLCKEIESLRAEIVALRAQLADGITTQTLRIVDGNGQLHAFLAATEDGVQLAFVDPALQTRLVLGLPTSGAPRISLCDDQHRSRIELAITPQNNTPCFGLLDAAGKTRLHVAVDDLGNPAVGFLDATATPKLIFAVRGGKPVMVADEK